MTYKYSRPKLLILLVLSLIGSCKNPGKKVIAKYRDETPAVILEYPDQSDTLNYVSKQYYHNGTIHRISTIAGGKFVGKPLTFYPDGKISQMDSLLHSLDISSDQMDADAISFYENGAFSENSTFGMGMLTGMLNSIIRKAY